VLSGVDPATVSGGLSLVSSGFPKPGATYWFSHFRAVGAGLDAYPERRMGPIAGVLFSLSGTTLKMTAQLMPMLPRPEDAVTLEVRDRVTGAWMQTVTAPVGAGFTALLRVEDWDPFVGWDYRVVFSRGGGFTGNVPAEPVSGQLAVVTMSCTKASHRSTDRTSPSQPLVEGVRALGLYTSKNLWFPHEQRGRACALRGGRDRRGWLRQLPGVGQRRATGVMRAQSRPGMFTSDNGYMLGEHRLHAGKTVAYEPSALVPLIITGPGFPANVQRRHPISQIDLAPTIADIAAATPTLTVDGVSLIPLARSPVGWPARHLVIEAGPRSLNGPMFYTGVRGSRYVYLEYHETVEVEFYDLMRDPYQLQNLEADPAYDGYQAQLARLLESMRNCVGADCR